MTHSDPASERDEIRAKCVTLLEEHGPACLALALSLCCEKHAHDVMAEMSLALLRFLRSGKTLDNPSTWLNRVIRNRVSDRHRKEHTQRKIRENLAQFGGQPDHAPAPPLPDDPEDPEDIETRGDELLSSQPDYRKAVMEAIPLLPERQGEVMRMRFEGMSMKEIADRLGCSEAAVHMAQNRAVQNLRKTFNSGDG